MTTLTVPVTVKKSSTPGAVPTAGQLQHAELGLNTADGKLFSKTEAGAVFQVAPSMGEHDAVAANRLRVDTAAQGLNSTQQGYGRTNLGLGTAATAAASDFAAASHVGAGGAAHAVATTSVAGFMAAADKTKLDRVVAGAPLRQWSGYAALNASMSVINGTKTQNGSACRVSATAGDCQVYFFNVNVSGLTHRYVVLYFTKVAGAHEGLVYYSTSGHTYSGSFLKTFSDPGNGTWSTLVLDMWDLTAGGDDWKDNDIVDIRIDFSSASNMVVDIQWVALYGDVAPVSTAEIEARLRVDTAAQGLSGAQQANGRANLGIPESTLDARYARLAAANNFTTRPTVGGVNVALQSELTGNTFKGTWNASTNSPTITSSVGTAGDYYVVSVAGSTNINGTSSWSVGDEIRFDGSVWVRVPSYSAVSSVAGRTGAVTLTTADIGGLGTIATQAANSVSITGGSISGITDLAIADGGTGASDAAGARTNLGLVIGTNVQAQNANLQALAGLTGAADRMAYFTGAGAMAIGTLTSFGRSLIDDADAAAGRTTLGLGTIATQAANSVSITGGAISGITDLAIADGGTGASTAAGARTNLGLGTAAVLNTGRAVGNVLAYESIDGAYPGLIVDNATILRASAPNVDRFTDFAIQKSTSGGGEGTYGNTSAALIVETNVNSLSRTFQWNLLSRMDINAANAVGGGEHCATYTQVFKNVDGNVWSLCTEVRDLVPNTTRGSIGIEVGMFCLGTDNNNMRWGIDISIGSSAQPPVEGTNIVSGGLRIGPTNGNPNFGQMKRGIEIKGNVGIGIDMSSMNVAYGDRAIDLPTNGKLTWKDPDSVAYSGNGAIRGIFEWNDVVDTFILTGVKTQGSAGAASTYAVLQVNGAQYAIELRALS